MVGNGTAFDVCLLPHWDLAASSVERFDDAAMAFEHHAELASILREARWLAPTGSPRHVIATA
jgi:hypothetical protein